MASERLSIGRSVAMLALGLVLASAGVLAQDAAPRPPSGGATAESAPAAAGSGPAAPSQPLGAPSDPVAAAAYAVLETHCARCHQAGKLDRPAPAGAFGNVLRLDELASAPHLVAPGNPDASRLYVMMLRRLMPLGLADNTGRSAGKTEKPSPSPADVAAIRTWIAGLPPRRQCTDRRQVTAAERVASLAQLTALTREDPAKLRFVSIAHLHNGCVRLEALAAYRQAVVRLFNSLSWKASPVAVPPVDVAGTLFKVNLDDLGWLPEHWDRIMRSGSDPLGLTPPLPADVRNVFGAAIPIARADWFAATVLNAPLYYDVLGLPGTGSDIRKLLQIEPSRQSAAEGAIRALAQPSRFALEPALVERQASPTGAFWQAYHRLAGQSDAGFGERVAAPVADPVPHHATRGMFRLPNGLPAFFVLGQDGTRLDALPPMIALPESVDASEVRSALGCLSCHRAGPAERPGDAVAPEPLARALQADAKATREALVRIGIDPDLTLDGVEPLVALAREHARPLDGARAAAEIGVALDSLRPLADAGDGPLNTLARRLLQGLVARVEVEAHAHALTAALGRPSPDATGSTAENFASKPVGEPGSKPADPGPRLVLYSDKTTYRKGDPLQLFIHARDNCHLTVVSIDTRGRGTVLFPSDFETDTLLTAGQELKLPGAAAPYALRLNDPGRETIVALCNEADTLTDGIRHDFEKQRFTDLGDYATFLLQNAWPVPAKADPAERRPEPRRRSRRRSSSEAPPEQQASPHQISRTAISIVVE